jgi:Zn-dependent M28 family amino/carboxypeptidase
MNWLDQALETIRGEVIDAHLRFLSHPLLEGRAPGTRGSALAMEYIRAQFRRIGLQPVGGTYFQIVPMIGMDPHPQLQFRLPDGNTVRPEYREEYVAEAGVPLSEVAVENELIYVGFGIRAPEYDWDDYADVDVRGKIVLVRVNDPGSDETPGFFGGRALTYYGRWTYKFEEAARQGAAGAILIHTDESAGYGWNVVRTSNTGEQYSLAGPPDHPLPLKSWIRGETADRILRAAGFDPEALHADSSVPGFRAVALGVRANATVHSEIQEVETANVVGLLAGSDPSRDAEPVILSSHYDHLGRVEVAGGETNVFPGAYDNASGVSLLLTTAEAAGSVRNELGRPLLFVATTAEESGLLGAEWYARNPLFPLGRTAAAINVDGANLEGRTRDLAPLGMDRSEVGDFIRAAAEEEGLEIAPESHPEQGMFFRQDHFPFARAGVPAVALDHGLRFEGRPEGWGEEWYREFVARHYHQPTDAYREGIDYGGAIQQGRVLLRAAVGLARAERVAEWKLGAEFSRGY